MMKVWDDRAINRSNMESRTQYKPGISILLYSAAALFITLITAKEKFRFLYFNRYLVY